MNRRGFITGLAGIFAAAQAPAIVSASSIMRIKPILLLDDIDWYKGWQSTTVDNVMGPMEMIGTYDLVQMSKVTRRRW